MGKQVLLFATCFLLVCVLFLQPSAARADSIPAVSITSATGDATWGNEYPPGAGASLSGPNFTLGFGDSWPLVALSASAGDPFPGNTTPLTLRELTGAPTLPGGTLNIGGATSSVWYDFDITAGALTSTTVPSGTATLILPAILSGSGTACLQGIGEFCLGTPTQPPTFIANVNFDIPGQLTLDFTPGGPAVNGELFSARFTPVPEPSGWLLVFAGLGGIVVASKFSRSRARTEI